MEFMAGFDLWRRIEEKGRLPEKEAVAMAVQVAGALHEAHKHGIIHRDIKPDNILLDEGGQAKLGDLGLIRDLEDEMGLTLPDKGLGTPNFIAPEQFNDARNAEARCDIYSLAATLYMALTGELPFPGRSLAAILRLKLKNELTPPRQLVPDLSEKVDWAIRRALQAEPERRHASCLEFAQALTGESPSSNNGLAAHAPAKRPTGKNERRQSVRYPCELPTLCEVSISIHPDEDQTQENWKARVQDISLSGAKLLLDRRFEPGTILKVQLASPDRTFQCCKEMVVVRIERRKGPSWLIGGKFHEPIQKDEVRKLL